MLTRRERLRKQMKRIWNRIRRPASAGGAVPIFIFGEMRSGTNMLTECMDRSPRTEVFNESDDDAFDGYALKSNAEIARLIYKSNATHVVFKSLADSARASDLLSEFVQSKGIWIYRDFVDVVNSALKKWSEHNKYLYYILEEPDQARWRRTNLSSENLELIKRHYARGVSDASARALIWYVRNSAFFEQDLSHNDAVRILKYEELVAAPAKLLEATFGFVNLPFKAKYTGHVSNRSVGRDSAPAIDEQVMDLCQSMLGKLDEVWKDSRPDIGPS